jgi:hypothetical protein
MPKSLWSLASQDSFLEHRLARQRPVDRIGGPALSIGSVGSAASALSLGSFGSTASALLAASFGSVMSWASSGTVASRDR